MKTAFAYRFRDDRIFIGSDADWPGCDAVVARSSRGCEVDSVVGYLLDGDLWFSCRAHQRRDLKGQATWPLHPESEMRSVD